MPSVYASATFTQVSGSNHSATATLGLGVGILEGGILEDGILAEGSAAWRAEATVTPDDTPYLVVTGQQAALFAIEVYVDGVLVDSADLRGAISVDRSIDQHTQRGSFAIDHNALASTTAFQRLAPQTCADSIIFKGVIRAAGNTYRYPLLANGVVDGAVVQVQGTDAVDQYRVVDGGGRLARQLVTQILPAGHNLYRERVCRKVLTEAGETDFSFDQGERRANKAIQLVDANPAEFCAEYLSTENRAFLLNREGSWVNPLRKSTDPVSITFDPSSIRSPSSIQVIQPTDVITTAVLTGSEQIAAEEEEGETCGVRSEVREVEIEQIYAPIVAKYTQSDVTGVLTDRGVTTGNGSLVTVQKVRITNTYYCDDLLQEKVETWRYYNPIRARYEFSAAGNLDYNQTAAGDPVYVYDGAVADDTNEGYKYANERWLRVSEQVTRHYYDRPILINDDRDDLDTRIDTSTFYGSSESSLPDQFRGHFVATGVQVDPTTGEITYKTDVPGSRLGSKTTLKRYYNPRASVKERASAGDAWESAQFTAFRDLTGGLIGIENDAETFIVTDTEYNLQFPREDGTVQRDITFHESYAAAPGWLYLYADGTTSDSEFEEQEIIQTEETTYVDAGDGTHASVTTLTTLDGRVEVNSESGLNGSGPAIDRLQGFEDLETDDLDEEDAEHTLDVDPTENRPITAVVTSNLGTDSGGCHLPRTLKTSIPWAENVEELTALGEFIIEEGAAFAVQFQTLPWYSGDEGEKIHITYPTVRGLDYPATVHKLNHNWPINEDPSGDRPIPVTTVTALIFPSDL